FKPVLFLGRFRVKRKQLAVPAALEAVVRFPLVCNEVLKSRQQKAAELAPVAFGGGHSALLEQLGEESLCQVLSLLGSVALPARKHIQWIPVSLAQFFQRRSGLRRGQVSRIQHRTPVRRGKNRSLDEALAFAAFFGRHEKSVAPAGSHWQGWKRPEKCSGAHKTQSTFWP